MADVEHLRALVESADSRPLMLMYLDPGTGSMIFQWLIAGVVGSAFAIKLFWRRLAAWFRKDKSGDTDDA